MFCSPTPRRTIRFALTCPAGARASTEALAGRWLLAAGLAVAFGAGGTAQAQPAERSAPTPEHAEPTPVSAERTFAAASLVPPDQVEQRALLEPEPAPERPVSIYAGANVVSMYVSRGLVFSNRVSFQPWFEIDAPVARDLDGLVTGVSVFGGNWNSLHSVSDSIARTRSGVRQAIDNWYEADLYAGLRLRLAEHWLTSLRFNYYTSPSDSFDDIHEIDWRVSYDDSAWWARQGVENFSLQPALRIAKEVRDSEGPEQWYFSPSLNPNFVVELGDWPVTVAVPLVWGFGADGQYRVPAPGGGLEEKHFGFFQTGLTLSAPLEFWPDKAGSLTLSGGVDVIFVSDTALNSRGNDVEAIAKVGLTWAY